MWGSSGRGRNDRMIRYCCLYRAWRVSGRHFFEPLNHGSNQLSFEVGISSEYFRIVLLKSNQTNAFKYSIEITAFVLAYEDLCYCAGTCATVLQIWDETPHQDLLSPKHFRQSIENDGKKLPKRLLEKYLNHYLSTVVYINFLRNSRSTTSKTSFNGNSCV